MERCCWHQSVEDLAAADLLRTVVESCPTKLLLANPSLDRRHHAELFQMNEAELDLLTGLTPRQQVLLKRPGFAKVLTLRVDPRSYWIYTNTPDNERVATSSRVWVYRGTRAWRRLRYHEVLHSTRSLAFIVVASLLRSRALSALAQNAGIRTVTASDRNLIPLQTPRTRPGRPADGEI